VAWLLGGCERHLSGRGRQSKRTGPEPSCCPRGGVLESLCFGNNGHADRQDPPHPRQTPEGETFKAEQRICQKLEDGGKPHKFPSPAGKTHVLLADFRTFKNGGDIWDRLHVALAGDKVPPSSATITRAG
jgi:hypothetical protein